MPGAEKQMRAFIAVKIPDGIKDNIAGLASGLEDKNIRLVGKEQFHITLFFFDSISAENILAIGKLLENLEIKSFPISLRGVGVFTPEKPHVLFVEIDDNGMLSSIHDGLKWGIANLGLNIEDRAFAPHLTIARVKDTNEETISKVKKFVDENNGKDFGSFACDCIKLIKSTLTSEGPLYEELFSKSF